jgi:hypothetical protein
LGTTTMVIQAEAFDSASLSYAKLQRLLDCADTYAGADSLWPASVAQAPAPLKWQCIRDLG